ncbi:hypothetical protein CWI42_081180 [Ordospora colligata]|uniref:Uncharacterized protein n=1 Tax=Ordospora colligata OC4 TaxID=1354746 RepID=A0A0B2UK10_9MICR|nr:uncharacterized protein M896_081180 [Ordospora colligata OC4]KHN69382.1 hypothetical protein M896_081180 [Ordospora colligata OC4]TBU14896.1 hypothetical protein CWI41_081170 [Ordospora colligata]TBU15027.1 hypothetical protein CWI40_081190 [Ordospora colligata]TBU18281.1 hypothetical protein CWI42_081180 [Ordospora colligata]
MGKHRDRGMHERKKAHIEFGNEDTSKCQQEIVVDPNTTPLNDSTHECTNQYDLPFHEDPFPYISEMPPEIEKKTSIMKQFVSGIERLFSVIRSAFRSTFTWISNQITSSIGEQV